MPLGDAMPTPLACCAPAAPGASRCTKTGRLDSRDPLAFGSVFVAVVIAAATQA
jgi:hypothetical protein